MAGYERAPRETENEHERRLITLAKQGDQKALNWLFSSRGPIAWLRRAATRRLWDFPDRVDDVVADTQLRILQKLNEAPDNGTVLSGWAGRIQRNVIFEFWKEIGKDRERRADTAVEDDEEGDEPLNALANVANSNAVGPNGLTRDEANRYFAQLTDGIELILQEHFESQKREYLLLFLQNAITEEFDNLGDIATKVGLKAGSADRARKRLAQLVRSQGLD